LDGISIRIIIKLIAISLDCVSMDVDGDFNGGFDGGFDLAVLGYQPQQSIQQLRQEAKQTHRFTDLFYRLC
jgi:hypothetical protein